MSKLLDADSAILHLRRRGVIPAEAGPSDWAAVELSGGVSSVVFAVRGPSSNVIVKQSLDRLRVVELWEAPTERILSEALMLGVTAALTPNHVPALLDVDSECKIICIDHSPAGWAEWKTQLMKGEVSLNVARNLGSVLAKWHSQTRDVVTVPPGLRDQADAFDNLRVDPYYRTTAERLPRLAPEILATADRMVATNHCLVHGDFSPKNILVEPGPGSDPGFWIIDHEVAHRGDPTFDVAFLLTHLTLKGIHSPRDIEMLQLAAAAFIDSYRSDIADGLGIDEAHLNRQIGCLLLARVHGKSPAEYLTGPERIEVSALGEEVLLGAKQIVTTTTKVVS